MIQFFKCSKCGSIVIKMNGVGCPPSCCGILMDQLTANTVDAAFEKHLPAVTVDGNTVTVKVGEVVHPMTEEHHIAYILLETSKGMQTRALTAADAPEAVFALAEGETAIAAYEYCTLHGFWKTEI